jgi:uncharacterized protein (DUF2147 family)
MRRHLVALIVSALPILCLGAVAVDAQEPTAVGLWQQVDPDTGKTQGWFLITDHNGTFEGAIARMFLTPEDPQNPTCSKCTGDQKDAPWLGLTLIKGMMRKGLDYEGGSILDPTHGNLWSAKMTLSPDGQDLTVRGYAFIEIAGKNQYWKRLPDCAYAQLDPTIITKFKLTVPKPTAATPAAPKGKQPAQPAVC